MAYKQDSRLCVVTTPLGKDVLILRTMTADEGVSELFRFQLDLVSHEESIKFADIIGKPVSVEIHPSSGKVRFFHGVVSRFTQGGSYAMDGDDKGLVSYQAEVVPWLWNLTRVSNCRVWEKKSVVDIVKDVFDKLGFRDYEFSTSKSYDPIEYCVQYRETDFNFVSRMLEEEGLGYAFRHENDKHTMVIFDTSTSCKDCPGFETMKYGGTSGSAGNENEIDELTVSQVMPAGKYALNGYDFTSPSDDLLAPTQTAVALGGNSKYELYDSPSNYTASSAGSRYVKMRMEAEEAASHEGFGRSSCPALCGGQHITLKNHFRSSLNQRYLLTRVHHMVSESTGFRGAGSSYENSFSCLPDSIPYRPLQRTPKPTIPGTQTALVVGPSGEEIHCDKYGRVRVQFYWDRGGKSDGSNVVWVRVAQSSAGKKWGGIFIPRIGQEVVVTFIDGDPDRPLITGVVYNAEQMPPYDLPANKTQSGIKTRSSKEGGAENFNEIRFEDKKGEELLYVHAEKDKEIQVENDRSMNVGHDDTVEIGNDRTVTVKRDHTESVEGEETLAVKKDRRRSVTGAETIAISKDQTITVDQNRSITVTKDQGHTIQGNWTVAVTKDRTETIDGKHTETIAKDYSVQAKKILLTADDQITFKTGSASVTLKKNGDISIEGNKINIKGSGDVVVKGSKVLSN